VPALPAGGTWLPLRFDRRQDQLAP